VSTYNFPYFHGHHVASRHASSLWQLTLPFFVVLHTPPTNAVTPRHLRYYSLPGSFDNFHNDFTNIATLHKQTQKHQTTLFPFTSIASNLNLKPHAKCQISTEIRHQRYMLRLRQCRLLRPARTPGRRPPAAVE